MRDGQLVEVKHVEKKRNGRKFSRFEAIVQKLESGGMWLFEEAITEFQKE